MKRRNHLFCKDLHPRELYLFHRSNSSYPTAGSLFGIIDKPRMGISYLESSSRDLRRFRLWHRLPKHYRYHRRASRSELRDYIFNLAWYECRIRSEPSYEGASVSGDEIGHHS